MTEIRNQPSSFSQQKLDSDRYYKRIEKDISQNIETQKKEAEQLIQRQEQATKTLQTDKVQATEKSQPASQADSKMKWTQAPDGSYQLDAHLKDVTPSSIDLRHNGKEILKNMGQRVDMPGKMPELKESYIQNMIQSRSHNYFLSRYAAFKVGMIGQLLSTMGVSQEELQKLQKRALEGAKADNIAQMSENMYNLLLTELLHGNTRKSQKTLAMFGEAERQLIAQMERLGFSGHWDVKRITEERIKQAKKIREEFVKEKNTLNYHYLYLLQDNQK
jgi:hypothetical protein